jgi:hypothetical protein
MPISEGKLKKIYQKSKKDRPFLDCLAICK